MDSSGMDRSDRRDADEQDTARLADLPVEGLPADAPDRAQAAVDVAGDRVDAARTAHDPAARRDPKVVMTAYAGALQDGDPGAAADLFAADSLLTSADRRIAGREAVGGWHRELLERGAITARPSGQGNDQGRLEVETPDGPRIVELAFDASGRIGTARWLTPEEAAQPQERRERTAT
jgi:hypothetical protein